MEMTIEVASPEEAMILFGLGDRNLKLLRHALNVELTARDRTVKLSGDSEPVEQAASMLNDMIELHRHGTAMAPDYLERQLEALQSGGDDTALAEGSMGLSTDGRSDRRVSEIYAGFVVSSARSAGQEAYLASILDNDIVFCIGPAGTGKTFLAVRAAVQLLRTGDIRRIILCRPAVEAGEKLGFLPGDQQAKINPYLRPLHDALNDILDYDQVKRYMERGIIEIIPLAYMRGRTLNDAFIILDEGQNSTAAQMKMFLTRMGMNSKIVVNGDVTQVDLPSGQVSGLVHSQRLLRKVEGIGWSTMQKVDIVRHPLVRRIVDAYEAAEESPPSR